jgi:hypothetical protein
MSSHYPSPAALRLADPGHDLARSQPGVARGPADPLAIAVRQAIASLLPGGEALRSLESASIVPHVGRIVPESVQ